MENKCVAGCMNYTGGEKKHHPDCPFYPESLTKKYDQTKKMLSSAMFLLQEAEKYNLSDELNTGISKIMDDFYNVQSFKNETEIFEQPNLKEIKEKILEDLKFLADKSYDPIVKITYSMASSIVELHLKNKNKKSLKQES